MIAIFESLRRRAAASVVGLASLFASTAALPYSDLVFFGDSLSDTGNVLSLTTAFTPAPFPTFPGAEGRFSNGPVWTESLAAALGFPGNAAPSNLLFTGSAVAPIGPQGGDNFAYGGARTGLSGAAGATTGLLGQLIAWNGSAFSAGTGLTRAADPNALYVLLAGANDMRDARSTFTGGTAADIAGRTAAAGTAATNIVNIMGLLAQAGARNFLVGNLANLGRTPEAAGLGLIEASTDASLRFNAALGLGLGQLDAGFLGLGVDLDIRSFDLFGLSEAISLNPASFGIGNLAASCIQPVAPGAYFFPGSSDINCGVSAFSDPLHPSALVHQLIGQIAFNAVVPLPGTLALMVLAWVMLWGVRTRVVMSRH